MSARTISSLACRSYTLPGLALSSALFKSLLAGTLAASAATSAVAAVTCKPLLSIKYVREIRPAPTMKPWSWTATIVADQTYCATQGGSFEIDFIRIKEYSPDLQFTERFRWSPGQFEVTMELPADESILDYRVGFVAPCVCREIPFD